MHHDAMFEREWRQQMLQVVEVADEQSRLFRQNGKSEVHEHNQEVCKKVIHDRKRVENYDYQQVKTFVALLSLATIEYNRVLCWSAFQANINGRSVHVDAKIRSLRLSVLKWQRYAGLYER